MAPPREYLASVAATRSQSNLKLSRTRLLLVDYPVDEAPLVTSYEFQLVDEGFKVPERFSDELEPGLPVIARGHGFYAVGSGELLTDFSRQRNKRYWVQQPVQLSKSGESWQLVAQIADREPSTLIRPAEEEEIKRGPGVKRDYGQREQPGRGVKRPPQQPLFNERQSKTLKLGQAIGALSPQPPQPGQKKLLRDRCWSGTNRTMTMLGSRGKEVYVPLAKGNGAPVSSAFQRPGQPRGDAAEQTALEKLIACGARSWAEADVVLDLGTKVGMMTKQAEAEGSSFGLRNCLYLISVTPPGGREVAVYVGKCQASGRLLQYTRGWRGFLGPGEGEPHKQAAWWWAAKQRCSFRMRVIASSSWVDGDQLEAAERFALSKADFAWNRTDNRRYRMGRDFWRGIGLEPAKPCVKQMLEVMFEQPQTEEEKRKLATVGRPFDL